MSWSAHLAKGLRLLGERWVDGPRRWIGAGENWLDTGVRAGMVAGAGYVLWRLLSSSWAVLAVAVLVVVLVALRTATKSAKGTLKTAPRTAENSLEEPSRDAFLTVVWDILDGAPAVHLTTLAARLTEATGQKWDPARVRAHCQTLDIPIRPKVRDLGGDRVSSGVHRDDLPPLPQPLPEGDTEAPVASYAAGQSGNATPLPGGNATAPTRTVRRVGDLRITAVDDPDNPHRTHVRVADPTRKGA